MLVDKEKLGKQMLEEIKEAEYEDEGYHYCSICRKKITEEDIRKLNFEYVKNKLAKNYAHTSCIKYKRRTQKSGEHS